MKKLTLLIVAALIASALIAQDAEQIIKEVDKNLSADSRIVESSMTVHGRTAVRCQKVTSEMKNRSPVPLAIARPDVEAGEEMWLCTFYRRTIMISGICCGGP